MAFIEIEMMGTICRSNTIKENHRNPIYWYGWTLIPAWEYNYIANRIPSSNNRADEVWEWIGNLIWHFTGQVKSYSRWDQSLSMVEKEAPGICANFSWVAATKHPYIYQVCEFRKLSCSRKIDIQLPLTHQMLALYIVYIHKYIYIYNHFTYSFIRNASTVKG